MADKQSPPISITALKGAFKEGAIPNERDYEMLIDLASVGGKALGATNDDAMTLHPGDGLTCGNGRLSIVAGQGVLADKSGVSVKVDGATLSASEAGVALRLQKDSGLAVDAAGLHVKIGQGVKADENGVTLALSPKGGLSVASGQLAVSISETESGLGVDEKGALKIKLRKAEGEENYIDLTDQGVAITADGIKKIKEMLVSVSNTALDNAVKNTEKGAKKDAVPNGDVEKKIATALNVAYTEGYETRRAQNQLAVKTHALEVNLDYSATEVPENINIKEKAGIEGPASARLFFLPGPEEKIITPKELSLDGVLDLSGQKGKVAKAAFHLLAVATSPGKDAMLDISGAEIAVNLNIRPVFGKEVKITPSGVALVGELLTASYVVSPPEEDASTYQWYKRQPENSEWSAIPGANSKTLTSDSTYIGWQVTAGVIPKSKTFGDESMPEIKAEVISFYNKPLEVKSVLVNGCTFAKDAGFPTTGFTAAFFTLELDNGCAADYTWSANEPWVSVDNGVVKFTAKGNGNEVVITGKPKSGVGNRIEYKFKLKSWFTNMGNKTMTWGEANDACAAG